MFCAEKRGWVSRENAFFILEIFRATHRAGLGGGYMPRRWRPQPPAHPDGLHITGSRADHAKTRAGKYQGGPRRVDQDGGGCRRAWSAQRPYVACATFLCACTFNLGIPERLRTLRYSIFTGGVVEKNGICSAVTERARR